MAKNKLKKYVEEIKKFLEVNYECYPLKRQKPDGTIEAYDDIFIIKTQNAGLVMIHPELWTCTKPYKYDLFTQQYAYDWADNENKIFKYRNIYDGKFKKNNIHAKMCIDDIKYFISGEYKTTIQNKSDVQTVSTNDSNKLCKIAEVLSKKIKFAHVQQVGTAKQGMFEIDFYDKNNKLLAMVEILSDDRFSILLERKTLIKDRKRIIVNTFDEAEQKLDELISRKEK